MWLRVHRKFAVYGYVAERLNGFQLSVFKMV